MHTSGNVAGYIQRCRQFSGRVFSRGLDNTIKVSGTCAAIPAAAWLFWHPDLLRHTSHLPLLHPLFTQVWDLRKQDEPSLVLRGLTDTLTAY